MGLRRGGYAMVMSEANNVWRVEVDGSQHEIELLHTMMNKRTIKVDGDVVEESRSWGFGGKPHEFEVGGQPARIKVDARYGGLAYGSSLHLNDRYVEPLKR